MRGTRGGILVEALVAVTVLATGIAVSSQALSLAMRATSLAAEQRLAGRLAAAKLAELAADAELSRRDGESGDFGDEYPEIEWSASVTDGPLSTAKLVRLAVRWRSHGDDRELSLCVLAYRPLLEEPQ